MTQLVQYLVAAMLAWVPARAHVPEPPEHVEARYTDIASDAAAVAFDRDEVPIFDGEDSRTRTAVLILSVASYESTFRQDVEDGRKRGDRRHSWCLMQLNIGNGVTREGWSGADLVSDHRRCFRAGLHLLQASFVACRRYPLDDRVSAYASGHCYEHFEVSRSRMRRARAWWQTNALALPVGMEQPS